MKTRESFEKMIIEKAVKDDTFRSQLMENPKSFIEKEMGVKIPEMINIQILEETSDTFYLVLPAVTDTASEELTEKELQQVSAGAGWEEDFVSLIIC